MREAAEHTAPGTDGPAEPSGSYTATVVLLGQVIALHGVRIARERSRPRPDRAAIIELERARAAAITACRALSSSDPAAVERAQQEYGPVYMTLLAVT